MIALEILLAFASALRCMFEILEVHDGLNHQFLIIILYMDHKLVDNPAGESFRVLGVSWNPFYTTQTNRVGNPFIRRNTIRYKNAFNIQCLGNLY
jgi:hypothetical protein